MDKGSLKLLQNVIAHRPSAPGACSLGPLLPSRLYRCLACPASDVGICFKALLGPVPLPWVLALYYVAQVLTWTSLICCQHQFWTESSCSMSMIRSMFSGSTGVPSLVAAYPVISHRLFTPLALHFLVCIST